MMVQKPSNLCQGSWVETSVAADADCSLSNLIVISILKKFDINFSGQSSMAIVLLTF